MISKHGYVCFHSDVACSLVPITLPWLEARLVVSFLKLMVMSLIMKHHLSSI